MAVFYTSNVGLERETTPELATVCLGSRGVRRVYDAGYKGEREAPSDRLTSTRSLNPAAAAARITAEGSERLPPSPEGIASAPRVSEVYALFD